MDRAQQTPAHPHGDGPQGDRDPRGAEDRARGRHRAGAPRGGSRRTAAWHRAAPLLAVVVALAVVAVAVPLMLPAGGPSGSPAGDEAFQSPDPSATPPALALPPWRSGAAMGVGAAVPDPPETSPLVPRPDLTVVYAALDRQMSAAELDRQADGAVLVLTLEPYDFSKGGTDQPEYRLSRIVEGSWDTELGAWARQVARARSTIMVRFAHEMNGTWYPWSEQVNGNEKGDYVDAWRHVVSLFRAEGATEALWVWSPNVAEPGTAPLGGLWPGRGYVDAIGLDGYNWGTTRPDTAWRSPGEIFGATLAKVRRIAPGTPVLLTETASSEIGGDKAEWVGELFRWAREHRMAAVVWFAYDKEADWRPNSSSRSERAFERAVTKIAPDVKR